MILYIDDLLKFTKDEESYHRLFETVIQRLEKHGFHMFIKKCNFCRERNGPFRTFDSQKGDRGKFQED